MNLDISTIPVETLTLSILKNLVEANKPEKIIISQEQQGNILCSNTEKWTHYRSIELVVNNRVTLEIPEKKVSILNIGGYKFFRGKDGNSFQCATCLNLMGIQPIETEGKNGEVRKLKLIKSCDCPKQK